MNSNAASQFGVKAGFLLSALAAAMLLVGLCGTSYAASPVSKDGTIHACYKVKGKPKGTLRVVGAQKPCKRGERKVVWNATGSSGASGTNGQAGSGGASGGSGQSGSNGTNGTEAALKSQIVSLALKVESLEGILNGVLPKLQGTLATLNGLNNTDLLGAVDVAKILTNEDPTEALNDLPVVKSLCTGTSTATEGVNKLQVGVTGLTVLGVPGLSLGLGSLPTALDPFSCVTP
jgi:hypothetical protein